MLVFPLNLESSAALSVGATLHLPNERLFRQLPQILPWNQMRRAGDDIRSDEHKDWDTIHEDRRLR